MSVQSLFLECSVAKLNQFMSRIEVCLGKLNEEQIWARGSETENAIGNLVLHLTGNLGQWIISGLGGETFERNRDGEFAAREGRSATQLAANLRAALENTNRIISGLSDDRLTDSYEIQKYTVSGVEAVLHVVEHFAMHTGQIIFATKMITGEDLGFYSHLRGSLHRKATTHEGRP